MFPPTSFLISQCPLSGIVNHLCIIILCDLPPRGDFAGHYEWSINFDRDADTQPRLTQGHHTPFTNLVTMIVTLTDPHTSLFQPLLGFPAHQHQQTGVRSPPSTSCLSSYHLLSLHFFTPHLHLCASSKICTASPLLLTRCNPDYPRSRGECEWQAATERTRWRSADDPCSTTTSPAYPLRSGLTHIIVIATTTYLSLHGHPSFLSCPSRTHSHPLLLPVPRLVISSYPRLPYSPSLDTNGPRYTFSHFDRV